MVVELSVSYSEAPLSALSNESRRLLSSLLNTKKVLLCECPDRISRHRDWRGLASLANISAELAASINEYDDKTARVLDIWVRKQDGQGTIGNLIKYLQWLDRYDVCDDIIELGKQDKLIVRPIHPVNHQIVVTGDRDDNIITFDDKYYGVPQQYNAYVLYAKEDREFVEDLLTRMRNKGFKLCTEDDLLPGHATEFEPVSRLISERCRYIVLVYSPDFLQSPAITFYMNLAQADGINKKQHNIIPLMYRECTLPKHLAYYHNLRYHRPGDKVPTSFDFWYKLERTLDLPRINNLNSKQSGLKITELSSTISNGYTPVKGCQDNALALPSVPIDTASLNNLHSTSASSITYETRSLSNSSRTSEPKKKKYGPLRKIYNVMRGKGYKNAIMLNN